MVGVKEALFKLTPPLSSVEVTEADKADIYLQLGQDNGKPGSYKLQATPKSVQVEAGDYSGIVSAIASLSYRR